MQKYNGRSGFTVVEVMVVAAVIGLLAAIAIPNFLTARRDAKAKVCVSNLKNISYAKDMWAVTEGRSTTEAPGWEDIVPDYIQTTPSCPSDGTYEIRPLDEYPSCDVDGHGLSDEG